MRTFGVVALGLVVAVASAARADVASEVAANDTAALKARGPAVLPILARLYESSQALDDRSRIAHAFYVLGWKSADAKRVLMKDARTGDQMLRVQVQYALGRVSDDADVVDVLLETMQNDPSPVFRDKAACALAYDQIHLLSPAQKVRLYEGLIRGLDDPKPQVRAIAALALRIQTGQTKGYAADAPVDARQKAIEEWRRWIAEYKRQL